MDIMPSIRRLTTLIPAVVIAFTLSPELTGQQHPRRPISQVRPYTSVDDILDREAGDSDPAGIHQYSEDIIALFVPAQVGEQQIASLANRLAIAEQAAHETKRQLVPQAQVVKVFNDMMGRVGAPLAIRTNEATVREFRKQSTAERSLTSLLSASRNGAYCNPAEAVYLLYLLSFNNGTLPNYILDDEAALKHLEAQSPKEEAAVPIRTFAGSGGQLDKNGSWFVSDFASHHHRATIKLFNGIAQAFGF